MNHPIYSDEALVREMTIDHMLAGRTIFQLWQLAPNEEAHAFKVLSYTNPPEDARILSLGCGIGGMERYWKKMYPKMEFTLVNQSQSQLELCVCPGERKRCRAEDFGGVGPFDFTVIAYMLGHADAERVLKVAEYYTKGPIMVLDVFDTDEEFNRALHYNTVPSDLMLHRGYTYQPITDWYIPEFIVGEERKIVLRSKPAMWIKHV